KLNLGELFTHAGAYALHADLLRLRRVDEAFRQHSTCGVDGAVLSASAFVLRFFARGHRDDRLLLVNLGADLTRSSFAEPLLAPPEGTDWTVRLSTEDPRYGGGGVVPVLQDGRSTIPGETAVVLAPM